MRKPKEPQALRGNEIEFRLKAIHLKPQENTPNEFKAYWVATYLTGKCPCGCPLHFQKDLWISLS
jgi:hypothetical protein